MFRWKEKGRLSGFTLSEMLVALVLISLIAVMASENLGVGINVWGRSRSNWKEIFTVSGSHETLRQLFAQAYPEWVEDDRGGGAIFFKGDPSAIQFISNIPDEDGIERFRYVRIVSEKIDDRSNLVLQWSNGLIGAREEGTRLPIIWSGKRILLRDVAGVHWKYFGEADNLQRWEWTSAWDRKRKLPTLVQLDIQFPGKRRFWPQFVASTELDEDALCDFDSVSRTCRH